MTGLMALKLLLATLVVSPLARLTRQSQLMRTRRLLGVWCFVWASLHLLSYLLLELGGNVALLGSELLHRPYLTLGLAAWLILLALTLTSTRRAMSTWVSAGKNCITWSIWRRLSLRCTTCGQSRRSLRCRFLRTRRSYIVSIALSKNPPMVAITNGTYSHF